MADLGRADLSGDADSPQEEEEFDFALTPDMKIDHRARLCKRIDEELKESDGVTLETIENIRRLIIVEMIGAEVNGDDELIAYLQRALDKLEEKKRDLVTDVVVDVGERTSNILGIPEKAPDVWQHCVIKVESEGVIKFTDPGVLEKESGLKVQKLPGLNLYYITAVKGREESATTYLNEILKRLTTSHHQNISVEFWNGEEK